MSEKWSFPAPGIDQWAKRTLEEQDRGQQKQNELPDKYPFTGKIAFTEIQLKALPLTPGVFILYDMMNPVYLGRSRSDIRIRLFANLRGSSRPAIATVLRKGVFLSFCYAVLPAADYARVSEHLLREKLAADYSRIRIQTAYDDWFL